VRSIRLAVASSFLAHAAAVALLVRPAARAPPAVVALDEAAVDTVDVDLGAEPELHPPERETATGLEKERAPDHAASERSASPSVERAEGAERAERKPSHGIGWVPIGVDSPDLLEQIHRQIASWDPHLVPDTRSPSRAFAAGEDRPDQLVSSSDVDSVVRAHMRRFRICHGVGQPGSVQVGGEVRVRIVILPHGSVIEVRDAGGDFPDAAVRRCVLRAFQQLSFPRPQTGPAQTLTYTLALVAGDVVRTPGMNDP
jgi:hypothetical protein